jgi:hypothetical protein
MRSTPMGGNAIERQAIFGQQSWFDFAIAILFFRNVCLVYG